MEHHTKTKGDLGVLKAQVDLFEQGWEVLLPLTEHAPFDLVAYRNEEFRRVQVKYRSAKDGKMALSFRSVWSDQNGIHTRKMNKNEVDVVCLYCPEVDKCFYVDPKDFNESVFLRVAPSKNNQTAGVNFAEDFKFLK